MNQNEQEFEQVMRTHKATIYTVCYMFSKDQDEVADLFQECLINLWRSWPNFEGRSDVRTWIYRVSMNVCVDRSPGPAQVQTGRAYTDAHCRALHPSLDARPLLADWNLWK